MGESKLIEHGCQAVVLYGFSNRRYRPEPAGLYFEAREIRDRLTLGRDCSDILGAGYLKRLDNESSSTETSDAEGFDPEAASDRWLDVDDDQYMKYLKHLDPTACKDQDHYKVLGLSKLRYKADENQIKIAYRKKVLRHHPDKRRHKGLIVKTGEEDYFTCISRAYETLNNTQKRRAYDSVDPNFDESIPSATVSKENFFKIYSPVFEHNERWSRKQPCPKFGDDETPFDDVDRFYKFWYDFDSWREFSYLDEEDKEKGENRDERRWIDKQNKALRDKRRKDEVKRIRNLVDNAYKSDPRIQKYKEDEKKRKEAEKQAKEDARRAKIDEEEKRKREIQDEQQRVERLAEEARKEQQLIEKREKDATRKALQKERKSLQEFCQNVNYFASDESERIGNMNDVDRLCQMLSLEKLQSLNAELRHANNGVKPVEIFRRFVEELNAENCRKSNANVANSNSQNEAVDEQSTWSPEETQLLIKGVTLFPVGTKSRWDVVAAFINEHRKQGDVGDKPKTGKHVVAKVKELQKIDEKAKESVSKGVSLLQVKSNVTVETAPSMRMESPAAMLSSDSGVSWTSEEQKLLEQALRTFPAEDVERWEKIAACVPGKTKKDCVKRYKEIAELVRARKVALQQQNVQQTTKGKTPK